MLRFTTWSACVGAGGFELLTGYHGALHKFTLTLVGDGSDDGRRAGSNTHTRPLLTASSCFNTLKMPVYTSQDQLEDRLRVAADFDCARFDERAVAGD